MHIMICKEGDLMTLDVLHSLLDHADKSKLDMIYRFLIRLIEEDEATEDENEILLDGKKEDEEGEYVSLEEAFG